MQPQPGMACTMHIPPLLKLRDYMREQQAGQQGNVAHRLLHLSCHYTICRCYHCATRHAGWQVQARDA